MNEIKHTTLVDRNLALLHTSGCLGERILEDGRYSPTLALQLASAASKALSLDTAVRDKHHKNGGNSDFTEQEVDAGVVESGMRRLLAPQVSEKTGLELGHIVNLGGEVVLPDEAKTRLLFEHNEACGTLSKELEGFVAVVDGLPNDSVRSLKHDNDNSLILGSRKSPVADLSTPNARVETHLRSSFAVYAPEGDIGMPEVRDIMALYNELELGENILREMDGHNGKMYVFPISTTLVGLRRFLKESN